IPEPLGGAHRNIHATIYNVEQYIIKTLRNLKRTGIENLLDNRYKKLRAIGSQFQTKVIKPPAKPKPATKPAIPERLSAAAQLEQAHNAPPEKVARDNLPQTVTE
ncbi:MAG: hypothetical protein KAJ07_03670, partial [Planctomycetes bacterium]|nr:hypothetical protein [Planctomycetota bacterium]